MIVSMRLRSGGDYAVEVERGKSGCVEDDEGKKTMMRRMIRRLRVKVMRQ